MRAGLRAGTARGGAGLLILLCLMLWAGGRFALLQAAPAEQKSEQKQADGKADNEAELQRLFDEEQDGKGESKRADGRPDKKDAERDTGISSRRKGLFGFQDRRGRSYELDFLVAGDLVGGWDREEEPTTTNRFVMREVELGLFASVDHIAEAFVSFAAHYESGETVVELHEAYLLFPRLLPRSNIKLGRFFFDAGRLNSVHRHEWAFTNAPLVHERLLGEEGAMDTGIEWHFLMPWHFWQELSLGVFNGETFGHAHEEGPRKQNPLVTARLKQFIPFGSEWGTQFGFSWLRFHPDENPNRVTQQSGLDLLVKWKRGKLSSFQWLSEVWYRETRETRERPLDAPAPPVETFVGAYTLLEYQFAENWFAGFRFDGLTEPNKRGQLGYTYANGTVSESLMLTYRPSEFSKVRVTAERTTEIETGEKTYQGYIQATFILGYHPAHQY